eukprot:2063711-Heterocapsa_arctica.AAC.1
MASGRWGPTSFRGTPNSLFTSQAQYRSHIPELSLHFWTIALRQQKPTLWRAWPSGYTRSRTSAPR